jgi:hypothetical protein
MDASEFKEGIPSMRDHVTPLFEDLKAPLPYIPTPVPAKRMLPLLAKQVIEPP